MNTTKQMKPVLLGILLGALISLGVAAALPGPARAGWEYRVVERSRLVESGRAGTIPQMLEQAINEASGEGWELAGFSGDSTYGLTAILRRPKR